MIKIDSDKNRYCPVSHNSKQSKAQQSRNLKTQCSALTMQEEFKTITSYFKLFDTIRNRNTHRKTTLEHSLYIPKHLSKSQNEYDEMIQSKVDEFQVNLVAKKISQVVKENKKHKKRYSCYDVDKSYQRQNWVQNILRRKNNGSYGQIVRGLSGVKHDSLLDKFQAISSYHQGNIQIPIETEYGQKFIPLGPNKLKNQPTSRKNGSELKGKKKINIYKRKPKINPSDYVERKINMETQRDGRKTKKSFEASLRLMPYDKPKITKKLTEPHKIQRLNLGPWDAL